MAQNIKWNKNQLNRLSTAVRKFNAKLTREGNKNPDIKEYLPQRKDVSTIKDLIKTRNDLKRFEREVNRLFKPGALTKVESAKGIKTTKYEVDEVKRNIKRINKLRAEERARVPEDPAYRGVLGSVKRNTLNDKPFNFDLINPKNWNSFVGRTQEQASATYFDKKLIQYKQNYLKALDNEFGGMAKKSGIYQLVDNMPLDLIRDSYFNSALLDLQSIYWIQDAGELMYEIMNEWRFWLNNRGIEMQNNIDMVDGGYVNKDTGEFFPTDFERKSKTGDDVDYSILMERVEGGYVNPETGEFFGDETDEEEDS